MLHASGESFIPLHPLGSKNVSDIFRVRLTTEITKSCASLGNDYPFGISYYAHTLGVKLGNKQWRSVSENVIVVSCAPGIYEPKLFSAHEPMLLGIVIAQILSVIKAKLDWLFVMNSVFAF